MGYRNPAEYVQAFTRQSGSSFYYSFLLLPRPKREAIFAVYAFCKYTDDLVDEDQGGQDKFRLLDDWRLELERLYSGRPTHIITQALAPALDTFPLPKRYFHDLIDGMEMDLTRQRYHSFEDLLPYCYRVASVVGLMCIEIFGCSNEKTRQYAKDLGIAFQLTNIIRDIKADADLDRIYLPQEDLNRFAYSERDLLEGRYCNAFIELMTFQVIRAKNYFQKAAVSLPLIDKPSVMAAEIMAGIYLRILEQIESVHYNVYANQIALPRPIKAAIALGIWAKNQLPMFG